MLNALVSIVLYLYTAKEQLNKRTVMGGRFLISGVKHYKQEKGVYICMCSIKFELDV